MNATWGDVAIWVTVLILFWGLFLAGLRAREWWNYERQRENEYQEMMNR